MPKQFFLKNARSVGALVRRARLENGIDQASLAKQVGVSRQWISEIENGKSTAELALVLRTFAALDLQLIAQSSKPSSTATDAGNLTLSQQATPTDEDADE